MTRPLTVQCQVHFQLQGRRRHKKLILGAAPQTPAPVGRVPRVSRLMALAIKFDDLIRTGVVERYAELAELGHVTRARVSQIMNLLNLAPDLQETLLHLPLVERGRDRIHLRQIQPIASIPDWRKQRRFWQELVADVNRDREGC